MVKPTSLSLGVSILLFSMLGCSSSGDGTDESVEYEHNGVYVSCLGEGQQWATWWSNGWVPTSAHRLQTCIGIPNISGADDAPFSYDEWDSLTNTFPAYHDQIAAFCEAKCWQMNQNDAFGENPLGVCSASGWDQHVAEPNWDPSDGYNCYTWNADQGTIDDPYASTIDWSGGAGSPLSLPLACSLLDECHAEFDGDIGRWTQAWEYGGEFGPVVPLERGADYYATASATTVLELDMDAGAGPGYDDAEGLVGYAEYSASDCGESTCPFYLASFSASNDTDVWDVHVNLAEVLSEPKRIENVGIDAMHSSLGVWRPSTGQVAFLPGTLVLGVRFDVASDCATCSGLGDGHHDFVIRNDEVVFGEFSAGRFVLEQTFSVVGGEATLAAGLDAREGPPSAAMNLSGRVECNGERGYVLSSGDSASTDPDGDIDSEMWIVDGTAVPNSTTLEVGTHTVALGVVDERGAWDFANEREIEVVRGAACL